MMPSLHKPACVGSLTANEREFTRMKEIGVPERRFAVQNVLAEKRKDRFMVTREWHGK